MRTIRVAVSSLALLGTAAVVARAQSVSPRVFDPRAESEYAPPVQLRLDQVRYSFGERLRPYFTTEPGAYVTVVRVTTDGELRVMYPRRPSLQRQHVIERGGDTYVPFSDASAFSTFESGGTGFVFAIASSEPFNYRYFTAAGEWSMGRLANTGGYGDPFEIIRMFVDQTLGDRSGFSMDYIAYQVYHRGRSSRYASRYTFDTYEDQFDRCMSAFGYGYSRYSGFSNYCGNYYGSYYGYYGQFAVSRPRTPAPAAPGSSEPRIKPLVPDPMLPTQPAEPETMQGRLPVSTPGEAAASARRERMLHNMSPRTEMKTGGTAEPRYAEPRRIEPRRIEPRQIEPRNVERRSEPRIERSPAPAPPPVQRAEPTRVAPAPPPAPVQKENQQ